MKTRVVILLAMLLSGVASAHGQESVISQHDLRNYFERSQKATGDGPYRSITVVEFGDTPGGPWKSYSSWIYEVILPDRSYLKYTSRGSGEFIHIGKRSFSRAADGTWTQSKEAIKGRMTSPSDPFRGFPGPIRVYTEAREEDMVRVTVTSKPEPNAEATDTKNKIHIYYFDGTGVLRMERSIGHNGSNWVHRTETYEYDPHIRIVAPIE